MAVMVVAMVVAVVVVRARGLGGSRWISIPRTVRAGQRSCTPACSTRCVCVCARAYHQ